jgi:CARDB
MFAQSPDLVPVSVVVGSNNVVTSTVPNPTVPVRWAVTNAGTGPVNTGGWYDRVYLSTNATLDGSDTDFGGPFENFVLPVGGFYQRTNTFTLPVTQSGNYYVIFKTDAYGYIFEGSENNNTLAVPVTFNLPVLGIQSVSSQIQLFWLTNATGFHLQSTASVGPSTVWGDVTNTPTASGGFYRVTLGPSGSSRYFRLVNP